jgi:hypothetical protein
MPSNMYVAGCLSALPSAYQLVRFVVRRPGLADSLGLPAWGLFDGHPWPWPPIMTPRCQMADLHSFMVIGPTLCDACHPLRFMRA